VSDDFQDDEHEDYVHSHLTINDALMFGDDEVRNGLMEVMESFQTEYEAADHEMLKLIRAGGFIVHSQPETPRRRASVWIDSYRNGRTYGTWSLECSPEGDAVKIAHCIPWHYDREGRFDESTLEEGWTVRAEVWRRNPIAIFERLVGKKIASAAAPLLELPATVAPDALV
jgi:hypothetical protein